MSRLTWRGENEFTLDGVEYACRPTGDPFPSSADRFCLQKPRAEAQRYERFLAETQPRTIVELGILEGGGTALMAQLLQPSKLIAIDLSERPSRGIERFISERGLERVIHTHWGVDQADSSRVAKLVERELRSEPLDLVIDDASHLLEPTRASFETLFPLLRPGGRYVIEDWSWAHAPIQIWPNRRALTTLVFELVVAAAHHPELIASVSIDRAWAVLTKGPAAPAAGDFSLADTCGERGRQLLAGEDPKPGAAGKRAGPLKRLLGR